MHLLLGDHCKKETRPILVKKVSLEEKKSSVAHKDSYQFSASSMIKSAKREGIEDRKDCVCLLLHCTVFQKHIKGVTKPILILYFF